MATKMSRRSLNVTQQTRSPSPHVSTSTGERPQSPLSPTRLSRIQEKAELQNLNDRLAVYIDTVRQLQTENQKLSTQIKTIQETTTREVSSIKNVYERELSDVRKLLDETAKDKAKLQLLVDKWKSEAEDLALKLAKKEKDIASLEKQVKNSDIRIQDLQRRLSQTLGENSKLNEQLKEAQQDRDRIAIHLAAIKKELEDETILRVDLANRLQSSKEELSFKEAVHEKEISETRQVKETEITELDTQLKEVYEQKLADTLRELREQYETQMRINRDEIETIYEKKLASLQNKLDQTLNVSSNVRDEIRSLKTKLESFTSKNNNLENQNASLQNRIHDLEKMLEQEREWHSEALLLKDEEIKKLREDIDKQLDEYRDLLDIKVALDLEIAAYRKLLEGEESRLNISPSSSRASSPQPSRSTPLRSYKRRRIMTDTEKSSQGTQVSARAKGDIDISDHDIKGKYVKIFNKGNTEVALGSWQLVQQGNDEEVKYKFPRAAMIKPNTSVTVWSSNSGQTNAPPQNLVMKNQSWCSATSLTTILLNSNGEESAIRETVRVSESSEVQHTEEQ